MAYDNRSRLGTRSTTSVSPKSIMEDIDKKVRTLDPEATPLLTLSGKLGRGKPPRNPKVQVVQYNAFDHYDYISSVTLGTSVDTDYGRFANVTLDSPSRPNTSSMYYYPQDKFFIGKTGQTVEVVMTPDASIPMNKAGTTTLSLPTGLTGSTTTATGSGTVVIRNIAPEPIIPFSASDVVYLGRTIYESQDIEAQPAERDLIYDCNYVEHKEKVIQMTEDQKEMVEMLTGVPDWTFQQEEAFKEFRKDIEYSAFFGERAFDGTVEGRPKRHMRGLVNAIKTNVSYYNPDSITDFEEMFQNFCYDQAFRYNPNGNTKLAIAGGRFILNFNKAFKQYRQTSDLEVLKNRVGLNITEYQIGSFVVRMARSEIFRQNSEMEHWCFIVDPSEGEWRIAKDMASRFYQNANERDIKLMLEWKGTIAWHREQSHALLRTY